MIQSHIERKVGANWTDCSSLVTSITLGGFPSASTIVCMKSPSLRCLLKCPYFITPRGSMKGANEEATGERVLAEREGQALKR